MFPRFIFAFLKIPKVLFSMTLPGPAGQHDNSHVPFLKRMWSKVDGFLLALLGAVIIASFLPAKGSASEVLDVVVYAAVAWLFFLYGVRLKTSEALAALRNWKLHSIVMACTYVVFPIIGLALQILPESVLSKDLALGLLFMTLLPSTVQSSIAFVSISRGNVAAAVVSASFSNLAGVIITPLLVALFMGAQVGFSPSAIGKIALQLLLPFVVGQLVRRWLAPWVLRHKQLTTFTDRGSVVLVVYSAFSRGVNDGIWTRVSVADIAVLIAISTIVLALMLWISHAIGQKLKFSREDQIVILMCGSKKSLATGVPMATVLFGSSLVGIMVLPIMIFHQIQLLVCAVLARRLAPPQEDLTRISEPQK